MPLAFTAACPLAVTPDAGAVAARGRVVPAARAAPRVVVEGDSAGVVGAQLQPERVGAAEHRRERACELAHGNVLPPPADGRHLDDVPAAVAGLHARADGGAREDCVQRRELRRVETALGGRGREVAQQRAELRESLEPGAGRRAPGIEPPAPERGRSPLWLGEQVDPVRAQAVEQLEHRPVGLERPPCVRLVHLVIV